MQTQVLFLIICALPISRASFDCSGHGTYDFKSWKCKCNYGYLGAKCERTPSAQDECYFPVSKSLNDPTVCSWWSSCTRALSCGDANPNEPVMLNTRDAFGFKMCSALVSIKDHLSPDGVEWAPKAIACTKEATARNVFFLNSEKCEEDGFLQAGSSCVTSKSVSDGGYCSLAHKHPEEGKRITASLTREMTPFQRLDVLSEIENCFPDWIPTKSPTRSPTTFPTNAPSKYPTSSPTKRPTTKSPTGYPTHMPSVYPTSSPTSSPTKIPTRQPTSSPTHSPTSYPTNHPTKYPTSSPTKKPTCYPTGYPTGFPTTPPQRGHQHANLLSTDAIF